MGASFSEYARHDAVGLAELVRKGEVHPSDLVEEAIARIERVNPRLNAIVHTMYARARAEADGELPDGPFRGVPFLIKDLLSALAGEPMQSGSKMYEGWRPRESSALVERYLATGAIVLGKTNTPELGLAPTTEPKALGPARNPWDPERTSGGSSGGSGAAVAARLVPMAGGGDGGGSIRIPSSACGIFGLKPTRGRTPVGPQQAESWHGFAQEMVLTRSVRDSAAMLDAIAGPYLGDYHYLPAPASPFAAEVDNDPGTLKVAYTAEPLLPGKVDPECAAACEDTAKLLAELGHEVVEARPPLDGAAFARAFLIMISCQTAAAVATAEQRIGRAATREDWERQTWLSARMGRAFSGGEYVAAIETLHRLSREVLRFADGYDVLLNPTLALPPPRLGFLEPPTPMAYLEEVMARLPLAGLIKNTPIVDQVAADVYSFIPWTPVYNATGQPSMSVPLYWSREGLPIGTMLTARFGDEATLYRLAGQLEKARPWADRAPPITG